MMTSPKRDIQHALEINDLDIIAQLAKKDRKVLSLLVRLAYDKDTLVGWRAITAIGLAARALIKTDYAFLRETCRKLLWSLSDESGGIGWAAPEMLGEIVSTDPEHFHDIIPLIAEVYDVEEKVFRPGVLYAMSKIAEVAPDRAMPFAGLIIRALTADDILARVFAVDFLKKLETWISNADLQTIKKILHDMRSDHSEVWVYKENDFVGIDIGEYVSLII